MSNEHITDEQIHDLATELELDYPRADLILFARAILALRPAAQPAATHIGSLNTREQIFQNGYRIGFKAGQQTVTAAPTTQPVAVPDRVPMTPADVLGPLEKRNIFDAIRCAYDLGYNDARNARAVPGDSAPGYDGRSVETDHGGALFNTMNRRLSEAHHGITTPKADK